MITIEQINAFTLVYQHGSYSAAARAVNKSRSTVREHVVMLEDILGVTLFEICGKTATPTEAAKKLIRRAEHISKQTQDFSLAAFSLNENRLDELVIYSDPQIPAAWLASSIATLKRRYPNMRIHCHTSTRASAYQAIEERRCHIAIMASENASITQARILSRYVGAFTMGCYCAPSSVLADKPTISVNDLRVQPQLQFQDTTEGDLGSIRYALDYERVNSLELAVARLKQNGWMMLSNVQAGDSLAAGKLHKLTFVDSHDDYKQGVCLFYSLEDEFNQEVDFAIETLAGHFNCQEPI